MVIFQDIQDVREWLGPLDWDAFWEAIAPYRLGMDDREHCDGLISSGEMKKEALLKTLKFLALLELRKAFNLKDRIYEPPIAQYLGRVH